MVLPGTESEEADGSDPIYIYNKITAGCIPPDRNIENARFGDDMTPRACELLCNENIDCYSFEFGVYHGVLEMQSENDCILKNVSPSEIVDTSGCDETILERTRVAIAVAKVKR